jgi:hypothetical protein
LDSGIASYQKAKEYQKMKVARFELASKDDSGSHTVSSEL